MTDLPNSTIEIGYESQLWIGAQEVFEMMVGGQLTACDTENPDCGDVTAMIGLAGDLCGLVRIYCSLECAGQIASAMLGTSVTGLDDGALDAIGEICNMVAGNFKAKISGLADRCVLSPPTVIRGSDYDVRTVGDGLSVDTLKSFQGCPLRITLTVHQ